MNQKRTGLYWFTNDLRLHDNAALALAASSVDQLYCVYFPGFDRWEQSSPPYLEGKTGALRRQFSQQSLIALDESLSTVGQRLNVIEGNALTGLVHLIDEINPTDVFRSHIAGWYENKTWQLLQQRYPEKEFHSIHTHTLFDIGDLPFSLKELPSSFTRFKNAVKACAPIRPVDTISALPPPPFCETGANVTPKLEVRESHFQGGEQCGTQHLERYFATDKPAYYKEVRNAIDGWDHSCKLSPWLANGCLSVREVVKTLTHFEENVARNESTYWIYFELLWREYFQWYAHKFGAGLFSLSGIKGVRPVDHFDLSGFERWVGGKTSFPIVNACMNELSATGYLSNRGRQIVASCFVNELAMDWRYGAAYFERMLIDYDVASNWGNWQYLAGVGADARDERHFNLEKQTRQFDPDGRYIALWKGGG